jgi:hypothetical protein
MNHIPFDEIASFLSACYMSIEAQALLTNPGAMLHLAQAMICAAMAVHSWSRANRGGAGLYSLASAAYVAQCMVHLSPA